MKGDSVQVTNTTTPTGQKFSPQKYRGHTLEILGVLSEFGGLTTREIANKTGLSPADVWQYCKRGARRGIFDTKESWGWSASPLGMLVLSLVSTTTTTIDTKQTQNRHNIDTKPTQPLRQLSLTTFTSREDIDESDRAVVGVLVSAYEKTGQYFQFYADEYEISRIMGIAVQDVISTLRHLRNDNCIYFRRDHLGWKIGLKQGFIERLKNV